MKLQREGLLRLFGKQLKAMGTYPGIITTMLKILNEGFNDDWIETIQTTNPADLLLIEAIKRQKEIGDDGLAKGYITTVWERIQILWERQVSTQQGKKDWQKEVIIALHSYSYGTWKIRNEHEHGTSAHSSRAQKRERLQNKIQQLYDKPRHILRKKDRVHFKLPVQQRKQKSLEAMELWILMIESIFKQRLEEGTRTLDTWLTNSTPNRDWKDKYKDGNNGKK